MTAMKTTANRMPMGFRSFGTNTAKAMKPTVTRESIKACMAGDCNPAQHCMRNWIGAKT